MPYGDKPFGLRDIKITTIDGVTQVDLPSAMTLTFKERLTTGELRGDDSIVAVVSITEAIEWQLENGGVPLEAWEIMTGHQAAEAGTTPNRTNTYTITAGRVYPYFKLYGKAVGENATDDLHVKLNKVKITEPIEGQIKDQEFWITKCGGIAVSNGTNIGEIVQNETAANLPTS